MEAAVKQKLDRFFKQYKHQKFRKGEVLIRPADETTSIFYLLDGVVRRYTISMSGDELTLNTFKPVSYFPVDYAISNTASMHYFEATTVVEVYKAPEKEVLKFIKENNDVMFDLVSRIYRGLEGYMMRLEYLMAGNAKNRLITELLIIAKRFGKSKNNQVLIGLKVTEKDLASASGLTRETVSREIQKLKKVGLVSFKGSQLVIEDIQKLEECLF